MMQNDRITSDPRRMQSFTRVTYSSNAPRGPRLVIDSRRANANTDGSIISCGE